MSCWKWYDDSGVETTPALFVCNVFLHPNKFTHLSGGGHGITKNDFEVNVMTRKSHLMGTHNYWMRKNG